PALAALMDRSRARARACRPGAVGRCRDDALAPHAARARLEGRGALLEPEALAWLAAVGIPTPAYRVARSGDEAVADAAELARPVALKIISPQILHKSDVGGVRLGLDDPAAIRSGFDALRRLARERQMEFRGVLVVPMAPPGVDVAVGAARSDLGGHVLLLAAGGADIEVLDDATAWPCPIDVADAAEMVGETVVGRRLARPR